MQEKVQNKWSYIFNKKSIYFILALTFIVRLYHINFPVGGFAAWRQADTAAMARNFYNNGFHLFSPEIDWGGGGIVESEFPIYQYIVSLLYTVFSPNDMIGRLVSVFFAVFTVFGLYLLVKKILGRNTAIWSALIYAIAPLNIFYSRAFMPESGMLMCSVWGIYYFSEWADNDKFKYLLLSAFFIAMAALLKIPALYLGIPVMFIAWTKYGSKIFISWKLWLFALLVLIPTAAWYYHAHQLFIKSGLTFNIWGFGTDKWGMLQPLLSIKWYNDVFFKRIAERHLTYAIFIPFIIGLFIKRKNTNERLFDWWLIAILIYFGIVSMGNQIHEYYQLPFVLPAVVFAAKTFNKYLSPDNFSFSRQQNKKTQIVILLCLVLFPVLSFLRISNYMKGESYDSYIFTLGKAVQSSTNYSDKVLAVDSYDPVVLYSCNRKGWHCYPTEINAELLEKYRKLGAKFLVGSKGIFDENECPGILVGLEKSLPIVKESKDFVIFRLEPNK